MTDNAALSKQGADISILMAIEAIKEIRDMPPDEGQKLLRSAWRSHLQDYRRLLVGGPKAAVAPTGMETLAELVALSVLSAYFEERGDWPKMIATLEKKREEVKL
jgi:hypothetical protein